MEFEDFEFLGKDGKVIEENWIDPAEYNQFVEMWEMDSSIDHRAEFNAWKDHEQECQDEMYMQEQRVLHGIS